jgi:fatty-acyl-CoA synthase
MTPLVFLERARRMFAERTAVIDGERRFSYAEFDDRVRRTAAALRARCLGAEDRIAVLAPNSMAMLEAHFAVPLAGQVLLALNVRLSGEELRRILDHSGAKLLVYDESLGELAADLGEIERVSTVELEAEAGSLEPLHAPLPDEESLLALNYTSGTTGRPKGVMYEHRGAYVQALAMAYHARLEPGSVHLWTLPMFHCNGWSFPWAVTAAGGTHVCLPGIDPAAIWRHIRSEGVTQLNAAPTVLNMIAWGEGAEDGPLGHRVRVGTGGSPPSPTLLGRLEELGLDVIHLYGLTETFGPVVACDWQPEWSSLPAEEQARLAARQGSGNISGVEVRLVDDHGAEIKADGEVQGEVQVRGNNVMRGYLADPEATREAFAEGGWFRTGDLGVLHPDGYFELRDRAKDVIISGGENIASIEVEQAIVSHPAVLEAAVVSMPDERWGEVPLAYVELRPGAEADEAAIVEHVRLRLAHFKAPKRVVFTEMPRTSTGKIQKFQLRERAWQGHEKRVHS